MGWRPLLLSKVAHLEQWPEHSGLGRSNVGDQGINPRLSERLDESRGSGQGLRRLLLPQRFHVGHKRKKPPRRGGS